MGNHNQLSFVLRAKNRKVVLNLLLEGEKISAQIEKQSGMYKSHVSRTMKELSQHNLIRCTNPKDRNYKFFRLTIEGKKVINQVNQIEKELEE